MIASCFSCWRSNGSERTVRFLAHASAHPDDHAAAGDAKSLAANGEAILTKLVGSFSSRGIECWHGFVRSKAALTVRYGQSGGANDGSGSCKIVSALVNWETVAMNLSAPQGGRYVRA